MTLYYPYELATCVAIVSTFASLMVDSELGRGLTRILAGGHTDEAKEERFEARLKDHSLPILMPARPRLDYALSCVKCLTFWSSLAVCSAWSWNYGGSSWWVLAPPTWLLSRLLVSGIRAIEHRSDAA